MIIEWTLRRDTYGNTIVGKDIAKRPEETVSQFIGRVAGEISSAILSAAPGLHDHEGERESDDHDSPAHDESE